MSPIAAEDHAAIGASSGGIAAFNLAWERPDLFRRVYSIIGTFVPFRNGDQFPAIIRKTEPKPIRVFFQDNTEDSWNPLFGSWYDYNRLMVSAMEFAGYEVDYRWDEGKHNANNGNALLEPVLQWLWKDWPEGPSKGTSKNRTLEQILEADACGAGNSKSAAPLPPPPLPSAKAPVRTQSRGREPVPASNLSPGQSVSRTGPSP